MTRYVEVAQADRIEPGAPIVVNVRETSVAIFNVGGRLFALDDCCVRCGSSIAAGTLSGSEVTCSGCDWRYDVITGRVGGISALRIDTFRVKTVGESVMLADTVMPQDQA